VEPTTIVQIVAGVLMVLCVAIIIWRRKGKKKKEAEDDF
jgi:preprotein translocase subunit YajC